MAEGRVVDPCSRRGASSGEDHLGTTRASAFYVAKHEEVDCGPNAGVLLSVIRKRLFRPGRVRGMAFRVLVPQQIDFNYVPAHAGN